MAMGFQAQLGRGVADVIRPCAKGLREIAASWLGLASSRSRGDSEGVEERPPGWGNSFECPF